MCDERGLACCECDCHTCDLNVLTVVGRTWGGVVTDDGRTRRTPGDHALGQPLPVGCGGVTTVGRLGTGAPPDLSLPRRRIQGRPARERLPMIGTWPVRRLEPLPGNGWHDHPDGVRDWVRVSVNRLHALTVLPVIQRPLVAPRRRWVSADGQTTYSGLVQLGLLSWSVEGRCVEFLPEETGDDLLLVHPLQAESAPTHTRTVLTVRPEDTGAQNAVIMDGLNVNPGSNIGGASLADLAAPQVMAEPLTAWATEVRPDGWRVHVRLLVQSAAWNGSTVGGSNDLPLTLNLSRFTATLDLDVNGEPTGAWVSERELIIQETVTPQQPAPSSAYAAALAGRVQEANTWLSSLEQSPVRLDDPGWTEEPPLTGAGPAQVLQPGVWRVPVSDVHRLRFAQERGAVTPRVGGRRVLSYDPQAVWLDGQPTLPLTLLNPSYPAEAFLGVWPRSLPRQAAYWSTPARPLLQPDPDSAQLYNLTTGAATPVVLSAPWWASAASLGEGALLLSYTLPPADTWDMWALLVREADGQSTPYQFPATQVTGDLLDAPEPPSADWHRRPADAPAAVSFTITPRDGRSIAGATLILALGGNREPDQ